MSDGALQDYTFVSRYARYNPRLQRRETWSEAVDRVKRMHVQRYPQVRAEIERAFELVHDKRVLGSQRALQFGGVDTLPTHAYLYNCTASYCDRLRFFQEALWLSLCGCGVGFSVQQHHVAKLPGFSATADRAQARRTFVVPDSIEGWADALGVLLSSYFDAPVFAEYANCRVDFDYSRVRPAGAPAESGSGTATGPEPLAQALEAIRDLLTRLIERGQSRLRPIDAYDIVMHASRVPAVRRSAAICIFSPDDDLMVDAKTGKWFYENPQRSGSNNSCLLLRGSTSREAFLRILAKVREYGEPGFVWAELTEYLVNPCCEVGFWPVDEQTGQTGWAFCNLSEINGAKIRSHSDFAAAAEAAALIGTWQAGYTDFPYLGPVTERIARREALLGVSITGIMDNPEILLNPKLQREMAEHVKSVNAAMARRIGIRPAARTTCVKPAGTSSCLLGTASGIHPHHARRYLRRVQAAKHETPLCHFANANPAAVEDSVWSPDNRRSVITFCIEAPEGAIIKRDFSAVEFLKVVCGTQQNWVLPGTRREQCTQAWLTHNVSNTVTVEDHEWEAVGDFIFDHRSLLTGVSLIPASADKDYRQAPLSAVLLPDEITAQHGLATVAAARLLNEVYQAFDGDLWLACDMLQSRGPKSTPDAALDHRESAALVEPNRRHADWLRRARRVAKRDFDDDARRLAHCLKDLHLYRRWIALRHSYVDVDYGSMLESADHTQFEREAACAGGACLV